MARGSRAVINPRTTQWNSQSNKSTPPNNRERERDNLQHTHTHASSLLFISTLSLSLSLLYSVFCFFSSLSLSVLLVSLFSPLFALVCSPSPMSLELIEDDGDVVLVDRPDTPITTSNEKAPTVESTTARQMAKARMDEVDANAAVTDTPATSDGKLDAQAIKLPHLLSPYDKVYPRSRGGDRWQTLTPDGHCMMCELEAGDGKGNVPVLHRVYGQKQTTKRHETTK